MNTISLARLKKGQEFSIVSVDLPLEIARRMYDMGLCKGVGGRMERKAFLHGPIEISIGNCRYALRWNEADGVLVTAVHAGSIP